MGWDLRSLVNFEFSRKHITLLYLCPIVPSLLDFDLVHHHQVLVLVISLFPVFSAPTEEDFLSELGAGQLGVSRAGFRL